MKLRMLIYSGPGMLKSLFNKGCNIRPRNSMWFSSISCMSVAFCDAKKNDLKKIEFQDPATLSHEYLIQQASSLTVNAVSQLLTQTAVAIFDIGEQYKYSLMHLLSLIEESQYKMCSSRSQEELSDLMIAARSKVNECKKQLMDMDSLFEYVEKAVISTAEASYLAGAEFVSSTLSERLYSAKFQVNEARKKITELEEECLRMQKRLIQVTKADVKIDR